MTNRSHLLINEPPLQVLPSLAKAIGLNEAIVLQQLHWWLENPNVGEIRSGVKWIFNTYEEWHDNFPFWSVSTIQRIFSNLENLHIIVAAQLDSSRYDRRKFYRIDYRQLETLEDVNLTRSSTHKMTSSKMSRRGLLNNESEKTPETTSEKKNSGEKTPPLYSYKWPHDLVEIAEAYENLFAPPRHPANKSEYVFWMNGNKKLARGFKHFVEYGVTVAELQEAYRLMRKEKLVVKSPTSLYAYATSVHDRNYKTQTTADTDKLKKKQAERRAEVERLKGTTVTE